MSRTASLRQAWQHRPFRFLVAGSLATLVSFLTFPILHNVLPGDRFTLAFLLAYTINITVSYQLQRSAVFRSSNAWWPEYGRFILGASGLAVASYPCLYALMYGAGLNALISNAIIVPANALASYLLHRRVTFRAPSP